MSRRGGRRPGWRRLATTALASATLLAAAATARAAVSSGAPASLLVFPLVTVDAASAVDTEIRLTNLGDVPQAVRCVYLDASLVAGSGRDFRILLTAGQPVSWLASTGRPVALGGGTVPAVPKIPFSGTLRCVAAEGDGTPTASDVLTGSAAILRGAPAPDSAAYTATGFAATGTSADEPDVLVLGGPQSEYDACPAELALQPFLDGATIALGSDGAVTRTTATTLALATCSSDPNAGAAATVDIRLVNELGQTFTMSRALRELLVSPLSQLDTTSPGRSIFNSAVAGSTTGNVRITPKGTGSAVLAVALTALSGGGTTHRAAAQPQLLGARGAPGDLVDLAVPTPIPTITPPPACPGDCDGNRTVAINELIVGVNIALGSASIDACRAFDSNGDGAVAINELITGVNAALGGCPAAG
ncbi:hypothetical protein KF840_20930 [bacterium]|nr:hypothetical protein [bacterium]